MVLSSEWSQLEVIDLVNDGSGLGFGIVGGKSTGVVIKSILPGGIADKDSRLQSGDHILQIGDVHLRGLGSEQVASVLRQAGAQVRMVVARPVEPSSADFQNFGSAAPVVPTKLLHQDPDELTRQLLQNGYADFALAYQSLNDNEEEADDNTEKPPQAPPAQPETKPKPAPITRQITLPCPQRSNCQNFVKRQNTVAENPVFERKAGKQNGLLRSQSSTSSSSQSGSNACKTPVICQATGICQSSQIPLPACHSPTSNTCPEPPCASRRQSRVDCAACPNTDTCPDIDTRGKRAVSPDLPPRAVPECLGASARPLSVFCPDIDICPDTDFCGARDVRCEKGASGVGCASRRLSGLSKSRGKCQDCQTDVGGLVCGNCLNKRNADAWNNNNNDLELRADFCHKSQTDTNLLYLTEERTFVAHKRQVYYSRSNPNVRYEDEDEGEGEGEYYKSSVCQSESCQTGICQTSVCQAHVCQANLCHTSSSCGVIQVLPSETIIIPDEVSAEDEDEEEVETLPETERFEVILKKNEYGLGITIAGYVCEREDLSGIFVKGLSEASEAHRCGRINLSDRIVEVDGEALQEVSNYEAVERIKRTGATVRLTFERYLRGPKFEQLQEALACHEAKDLSPQSPSVTTLSWIPIDAETQIEPEGESVASITSEVYESNPETREIFIEEDFEAELTEAASSAAEATIRRRWEALIGGEADIVVAHLTKLKGLGISLEGTVDVEGGVELRPRHYIRSILPEGPVGQNGSLSSGDELLEVNGQKLLGKSHVDVVQILRELPNSVRLVCARKSDENRVINTSQDREAFEQRNILGEALNNLLEPGPISTPGPLAAERTERSTRDLEPSEEEASPQRIANLDRSNSDQGPHNGAWNSDFATLPDGTSDASKGVTPERFGGYVRDNEGYSAHTCPQNSGQADCTNLEREARNSGLNNRVVKDADDTSDVSTRVTCERVGSTGRDKERFAARTSPSKTPQLNNASFQQVARTGAWNKDVASTADGTSELSKGETPGRLEGFPQDNERYLAHNCPQDAGQAGCTNLERPQRNSELNKRVATDVDDTSDVSTRITCERAGSTGRDKERVVARAFAPKNTQLHNASLEPVARNGAWNNDAASRADGSNDVSKGVTPGRLEGFPRDKERYVGETFAQNLEYVAFADLDRFDEEEGEKCGQGGRLLKAVSDSSLNALGTPGKGKTRSRSLENNNLAMWADEVEYVDLLKTDRGLGFSILDYQDPLDLAATVIVVRSLVPNGPAEVDGRLKPGDRLVSVEGRPVRNCTLDQAVRILKGTLPGRVRIGVSRPLPPVGRASSPSNSATSQTCTELN